MSVSNYNPFTLFPEELWLMIIKSSEQSTFHSLFAVFPEFFETFKRHVTSIQFTVTSDNRLKHQPGPVRLDNDKLITKQWCDAVDYLVHRQHVESVNFSRFQCIPTWKKNVAPVKILSTRKIRSFKPSTTLQSVEFSNIAQSTRVPFLTAVADFLEKRGESINVAVLDLSNQYYPKLADADKVFQLALKCLKGMKNVHTLSVRFSDINNWCDVNYAVKNAEQRQEYPKLPYLNCLEVRDLEQKSWFFGPGRPNCPVDNLTLRYFFHGYISKGKVNTLRFLRSENTFYYNEEYELDNISHQYTNLNDFIYYTRYSNMKSITIKPKNRVYIICLMWWFVRMQFNVKEVLFEDCKPEQLAQKLVHVVSVSYEIVPLLAFVKYLKITDSLHLQFRFLTGLPNLEHLYVRWLPSERQKILVYNPSDDQLTRIVRKYVYEDYSDDVEGDIWTELPSLKTLVVHGKDKVICKHFVRDMANKPLIFIR